MFDTTIQRALETAVEDDSVRRVHCVTGDIFTNPEIFELEMQYIFERDWIYLAHQSQVLERHGYFRSYIGRHPVLITSTRNGKLNAFVTAFGQRPHELIKIPRFESYRGFLFGSLNSEVVPLTKHLGEAATIIDLIVGQSPEGLEVLRGCGLTYRYARNWKRRAHAGSRDGGWAEQDGRFYCFKNGHLLLSHYRVNLPAWSSRCLCLYPNLLLTAQQIRHYRPIALDQTEVSMHCIVPKGESTPARMRRIRQHEDFCNVGHLVAEDRGMFAIQHEYWREAMRLALVAERRL